MTKFVALYLSCLGLCIACILTMALPFMLVVAVYKGLSK